MNIEISKKDAIGIASQLDIDTLLGIVKSKVGTPAPTKKASKRGRPKGSKNGKTKVTKVGKPLKKWTTAEDVKVRRLFAKGKSIDEIATVVGRTSSSVKNRCYTLKLKR